MRVVLHPKDYDANILLGPFEGALGRQDAQGQFLTSGRNAYPCGGKTPFADALPRFMGRITHPESIGKIPLT